MNHYCGSWYYSSETEYTCRTVDVFHLVLGGADKLIKLWQLSSLSCVQEYHGHEDVVRDVDVFSSEQFVSVANDWSVIVAV